MYNDNFDAKNHNNCDNSNEKSRSEELNNYWDISKLIPPKKAEKQSKKVSFDTNTTEIRSDSNNYKREVNASSVKSSLFTFMQSEGKSEASSEFKRFIPPYDEVHTKKKIVPDIDYTNNNSLIKQVKIYNWPLSEKYKTKFVSDALKLWEIEGFECNEVPFFSPSPLYNQLTKPQLAWYLWWRSNFRKGIYLETDYCYILLHIYEIINLAPILDKEYCLDKLCKIWVAYGAKYEYVARRMCEWVCDFCLIYKLQPPLEKIKKIYSFVLKNSFLKEFYVPNSVEGENINADILLAFCSSYDYKKSRCATPERLPIMEKHIKNVLNRVIKLNSEKGNLFYGLGFTDSKVTRISFTGAYCAPENKKKIEVKYSSFSRSYELNYFVADIIRYTENKLRSGWGIKSKLSIYALGTNIKKCIDEYFEENPILKDDRYDKKGHKKIFEYDKLYDVPKKPLSVENAAKIEKSSWDTTKILVEAFESENNEKEKDNISLSIEEESKISDDFHDVHVSNDTINSEISADEIASKQTNDDIKLKDLLGEKYEFLIAVLDGDENKQNEISTKLISLPDALVDEINEIASDIVGDILIEQDENGKFKVIDDYRDLI